MIQRVQKWREPLVILMVLCMQGWPSTEVCKNLLCHIGDTGRDGIEVSRVAVELMSIGSNIILHELICETAAVVLTIQTPCSKCAKSDDLTAMYLLDLPTEVTRLIVQSCYESWNINICKLAIGKDARWRFEAGGLPKWELQLTCHTLRDMAREAEKDTFTGKMFIEEELSAMSLVYEAFIEATQTNERLDWVRRNVKVVRFSNPTNNPAVWRFVHSLYEPKLPKLQKIELDCRYASHFAVHNVGSAAEFISGADGKLEKLLDYRQSFFLGCERFLVHSVRRGIAIRVIRNLGVREGIDRCKAMVVAIDYVADESERLILDWSSLDSKTAIIQRWPDKIREALGSLEI